MEHDHVAQVQKIITLLSGKKLGRESPPFRVCMEWLRSRDAKIPEALRLKLIATVCDSFDLPEAELYSLISGYVLPESPRVTEANGESALWSLLPEGSWLRLYAEYTRNTESPLSYHLFCSLAVLGAALQRRVWKAKGFFNIYPNYCVILIGPTGKVKKTSAIDIAKGMIETVQCCPIMADKPTPEYLVSGLIANGGSQFLYVPEFSVFFGRQKYNEGLATLMLRLLDSPSEFKPGTMARGEEIVHDVTLTVLGGSTMSLLANATPEQVTSSGFLNRFVLVVEQDTERCFPEPKRASKILEQKLLDIVVRMKGYVGVVEYTPEAQKFFDDWYRARWQSLKEETDEVVLELKQRGTVHMERTAMLLHLADHGNRWVCEPCARMAARLIEYAERHVPRTAQSINQSLKAQDTQFVLDVLKKLGSAADHSKLLRRCSARMDAQTFKRHINTLIESGVVHEERRDLVRFYIIAGGE